VARPAVPPASFAILAWGSGPNDIQAFEGIRECGFNLTLVPPENASLARQTGDLGNVHGFCLYDEPGTGLFPGLARWTAALHKTFPGKTVLVNLFPNYATSAQLGAESYGEYLDAWADTLGPGLLCYDHYALMEDGTVAEAGYFQNLAQVRAKALERGVPFWNVVISQGCLSYAVPTDAGLRFQLYTTLAHGARGIVYWRYFAPARGNYRMAPVDQFGNRTATWDILRDVNLQTRHLAGPYAGLKSVNVFHHPDPPPGCSGLDTSCFVESLSGGRFVVGEFEDADGRPWVMVVNKDICRSVQVNIKFSASGRAQVMSAFTGQAQEWEGENTVLAPGQGALLSPVPE
jgi:hypothetical protein